MISNQVILFAYFNMHDIRLIIIGRIIKNKEKEIMSKVKEGILLKQSL